MSDLANAARRANARRSTGPRTAAGKAASSRNAVKHGLSVSSYAIPRWRDRIEAIVDAIRADAGGQTPAGEGCVTGDGLRGVPSASDDVPPAARAFAEAQVDWERAREARLDLLADPRLAIPPLTSREAEHLMRRLLRGDGPVSRAEAAASLKFFGVRPDLSTPLAGEGIAATGPRLDAIDRYEARAFSRLRRETRRLTRLLSAGGLAIDAARCMASATRRSPREAPRLPTGEDASRGAARPQSGAPASPTLAASPSTRLPAAPRLTPEGLMRMAGLPGGRSGLFGLLIPLSPDALLRMRLPPPRLATPPAPSAFTPPTDVEAHAAPGETRPKNPQNEAGRRVAEPAAPAPRHPKPTPDAPRPGRRPPSPHARPASGDGLINASNSASPPPAPFASSPARRKPRGEDARLGRREQDALQDAPWSGAAPQPRYPLPAAAGGGPRPWTRQYSHLDAARDASARAEIPHFPETRTLPPRAPSASPPPLAGGMPIVGEAQHGDQAHGRDQAQGGEWPQGRDWPQGGGCADTAQATPFTGHGTLADPLIRPPWRG